MRTALFAFCLLAVPCYAGSAGILVDPSYIKFGDVVFDGTVRLEKSYGYLLKIGGDSDAGGVYEISLRSCKESGVKPNGGYSEFPDLDWFVFKSTDVFIPARSQGYLRYLELSVPEKERGRKGRWQLVMRVAKKNREALGVEVLLPVWIETRVEKKTKRATGEVK